MLKKISRFFQQQTKILYVVLPLFLIILLFFLLPYTEELLKIDSSHISLDKPRLYSPLEIHNILTDWGEEGRISQFWLHITWDLMLPLFYFFFLGFLISLMFRDRYEKSSRIQYFNLVSLVAVIDILENISLFILLTLHPKIPIVLCWIKILLTMIKYYLFGPGILIALTVGVVGLYKQKRSKNGY